jgi:hypothetical protein
MTRNDIKSLYENKEIHFVSDEMIENKGLLIRYQKIEPLKIIEVVFEGVNEIKQLEYSLKCINQQGKEILICSDKIDKIYFNFARIPQSVVKSYDSFLTIKEVLETLQALMVK